MPRITIIEPNKKPQPYSILTDRDATTIGRLDNNDIIIESTSASGNHCTMKRVKGGFILEDNGSTNGIRIDDTRFQIIDLKDTTEVTIGEDIKFVISYKEEELELLEEEGFESQQKVAFPNSRKIDQENIEAAKAAQLEEQTPKAKAVEVDDEDEDEEDLEYQLEIAQAKVNAKKRKNQKKAGVSSAAPILNAGAVAGAPNIAPATIAPVTIVQKNTTSTMVLFILLAVGCLLGGMVARHYQDHGVFLFNKQIEKK